MVTGHEVIIASPRTPPLAPRRCPAMRVRHDLEPLLPDEEFAAVFGRAKTTPEPMTAIIDDLRVILPTI